METSETFVFRFSYFGKQSFGLRMILILPICKTWNLVFDRGNSLKDPASKAYAQVFAPYHGWAIRKAVAAGMYALPTKAQLMNKLNEDGKFSFLWIYDFVTLYLS